MVPVPVNDILKGPRASFPETPGTVVLLLMFAIHQQDFFSRNKPVFLQLNRQAQACAAHAGDNIIVLFVQVLVVLAD